MFSSKYMAPKGRIALLLVLLFFAATIFISIRNPSNRNRIRDSLPGLLRNGAILPKFSRDFKNPCWTETGGTHYQIRCGWPFAANVDSTKTPSLVSAHRLRCLPYFFLVGMPKSATTDLFHSLVQHPSIMKTRKEPRWLTRHRYRQCEKEDNSTCTTSIGKSPSLREYLDIYDEAAQCIQLGAEGNYSPAVKQMVKSIIVGDASTATFWDNDIWPHLSVSAEKDSVFHEEPYFITANFIRDALPAAKIIIILRDPTERLLSDYLFSLRSKRRKSASDFHNKVESGIKRMTECTEMNLARQCVYNASLNKIIQVRLRIGMYSVYMRDWLKVFPREQIHVTRTEEYKKEPLQELAKIYQFLGVEQLPKKDARLMQRAVKRNAQKYSFAMFNKTKLILREFYSTYNKDLARILDDDRFLWQTKQQRM